MSIVFPAGCRSWFGSDLVHSNLRARLQPKSVDLHDTKYQQRPCLMIMRDVRDPSSACLALVLSTKLRIHGTFCIVRVQVSPSGEETVR
ncbi:hypothetical protein TNCV_398891 [Trichonephila clavipes]|uniref:Uncharacterized protein n=1 Tax=Trichonephila clavipes TaxID=2585209 RepID=A0A8X7B7R3_TRICX|nr:hypothetical protein TNCV_398891 [Trichonephila clavipes]